MCSAPSLTRILNDCLQSNILAVVVESGSFSPSESGALDTFFLCHLSPHADQCCHILHRNILKPLRLIAVQRCGLVVMSTLLATVNAKC